MTIAFVQSKLVVSPGASPSVPVTMDSACGSGNLLVAFSLFRSIAGSGPGSPWSQIGSTVDCNGAGDDGPILMWAKTTTGGQTTVGTWSHTSDTRVVVMEFSGVALSTYSSPASLSDQSASSHPVLSAIGTPAGQQTLIVAGFTQCQGVINGMAGFSPDSGYTEVDDGQVDGGGGGPRGAVIYQIATPATASSYAPGVTGGNLIWGGVGAAFQTSTPANLALSQAIVVL